MSKIHNFSAIHSTAVLGENVSVGPFTSIGPNVTIGDNAEIGSNVNIEGATAIGNDCRISHGACLGVAPQIVDFDIDTPSSVKIGDATVIQQYVTISRSGVENGVTEVGHHCMLMAYAHVAHDCRIGNHVVIANGTNLSGHVQVEDRAFISGIVGVHQFVRIGKYAMVGGMTAIRKDVLPFSMVRGNPARMASLNSVGLRRSGFPPRVRAGIKRAFRFLQNPELNASQAVEKIETEIETSEEIRYLINFIKNSSRGITS